MGEKLENWEKIPDNGLLLVDCPWYLVTSDRHSHEMKPPETMNVVEFDREMAI